VCTTQIKMEAFLEIGDANASQLEEQMLGDVIWCLINPDDPLPALPECAIKYVEGGPAGVPDAADKVTAVYATFEVEYEYLIGNPYQQ